MASTEDRIRNLVAENLEVDGKPIALPEDLNISLMESGMSSLDLVEFAKVVSVEFDVKFTLEDCVRIKSIQELVEFLDAGSA